MARWVRCGRSVAGPFVCRLVHERFGVVGAHIGGAVPAKGFWIDRVAARTGFSDANDVTGAEGATVVAPGFCAHAVMLGFLLDVTPTQTLIKVAAKIAEQMLNRCITRLQTAFSVAVASISRLARKSRS